jgi:hypothetical protein
MQRPAWRCNCSVSVGSYTSRQSINRIGTGRRGGSSRSRVFKKPFGSAI